MRANGPHLFVLLVVICAALLMRVNQTGLFPFLAVDALLGLFFAELLHMAGLERAILGLGHTLVVVES